MIIGIVSQLEGVGFSFGYLNIGIENNMLIATSLSPSHNGAQSKAVSSWHSRGEVYSLNIKREMEHLQPAFPDVKFKETTRTIQHITGKPLVTINAMIDLAIEKEEDLLLINSDIIIGNLLEFKRDGITILNRYDFTNEINDGQIFPNGFDLFFIPNEFLNIFPPSIYSMGATWWDYWIPYIAILNKIPLYSSMDKHIFHKTHPLQYSHDEWQNIGEYFRLDFKLEKGLSAGQIATRTLALIKSNLIYE